jgi:23S rRNA pseudouridine2605 synthase
VRINRFVATATGLSRRAADAAVAAGRVSVDGVPAITGQTVAAGATVIFDGRPIELNPTPTYLALNKPAGYVSSRTRQGSDPTMYELLPDEYHALKPAGRLDRDSSGLMLLSDDGEFIQRHTHPSHTKQKVYELRLDRSLTAGHQLALKQGVELNDGPSHVIVLEAHGADVTVALSEGRNRQLRRTFGALGYSVLRLHRLSIGRYHLGNLEPGQWRTLKPDGAQ